MVRCLAQDILTKLAGYITEFVGTCVAFAVWAAKRPRPQQDRPIGDIPSTQSRRELLAAQNSKSTTPSAAGTWPGQTDLRSAGDSVTDHRGCYSAGCARHCHCLITDSDGLLIDGPDFGDPGQIVSRYSKI